MRRARGTAASARSSGTTAVPSRRPRSPTSGCARARAPRRRGRRPRASRLPRMAKNSTPDFVLRPFEGLPGETDWVAMREVVPSATATARTTAEHGARDVLVVTVLPAGWAALHRQDGTILLAVQTLAGSGDTSRDLAAALLEAIDAEPGTSIELSALPEAGPRLQDVLDLSVPFDVTVHEDFSFWLDPSTEVTPDLRASLDQAA